LIFATHHIVVDVAAVRATPGAVDAILASLGVEPREGLRLFGFADGQRPPPAGDDLIQRRRQGILARWARRDGRATTHEVRSR
jgi:hypothetical protein